MQSKARPEEAGLISRLVTRDAVSARMHETQLRSRNSISSISNVARSCADVSCRGSPFLKSWMDFLEENADLRYPNITDVYVDERSGG
jgi:hypothetical protein